MANFLYNKAKESFLKAEIDWEGDTIRAALTRELPAVTDQFLSEAGTIVSTSGIITTTTATDGTADGDDVTFTAVAAGAAIPYLLVYQDTGSAATSRLIAAIDTATGLPVTPNGGDVDVQWDAGINKIFRLN